MSCRRQASRKPRLSMRQHRRHPCQASHTAGLRRLGQRVPPKRRGSRNRDQEFWRARHPAARCVSGTRRVAGVRESSGHGAGQGGGGGQEVQSARPRRRGIPCRGQVGFSAQRRPARVSGVQWRRVPNQGPSKNECCWVATLTSSHRGVATSASRWGARTLSIYIRGELRREADIVQAAVDEAYARRGGWDRSGRVRTEVIQAGHHRAPGRRCLHLWRGKPPCWSPSRASADGRATSRPFLHQRSFWPAPLWSTTWKP